MKKEHIGAIFGFAAIALVAVTLLSVVLKPVEAQDEIVVKTVDASPAPAASAATCGAGGTACDGSCGGSCGGSCAAAKTGSCGCGA